MVFPGILIMLASTAVVVLVIYIIYKLIKKVL